MIKSKRKLAFESGLTIEQGESKHELDLTKLSARDFSKFQAYVNDKTIEGEGLREAITSELFKRTELGEREPTFLPPVADVATAAAAAAPVSHQPRHLTSDAPSDGQHVEALHVDAPKPFKGSKSSDRK